MPLLRLGGNDNLCGKWSTTAASSVTVILNNKLMMVDKICIFLSFFSLRITWNTMARPIKAVKISRIILNLVR